MQHLHKCMLRIGANTAPHNRRSLRCYSGIVAAHLLAALDRVYTSTKEIEGLARELTSELAGAETDLGDLLGMDTTSN